jgi:hypothetical protein
VKKCEPIWVTCPHCGQKALGNYKNNPNLAICPGCKAAGKPAIFTCASENTKVREKCPLALARDRKFLNKSDFRCNGGK